MSQGYGTDTFCTDSLKPGRLVRGPALVAQAIYRRFITPRGTLRGGPEELAYGFDLAGYVGAVGYDTAVNAIPAICRAEAMKDERVADVVVNVSRTFATDGTITLLVDIRGTLANESGTFALTLAVDAVTVELVGGVS